MTHEQITGNVAINLIVGLFLIVVGAVLQPLLKRMWQRMNQPVPLTPQTKGQLVTSRAIWEAELERLDYLSTHSKDLFLRVLQLMMVVLLFLVAASWLFAVRMLLKVGQEANYADVFLLFMVVMLTFAGAFSILGIKEADRLSGKKIDASKETIQKRIDEIDRQLNSSAK